MKKGDLYFLAGAFLLLIFIVLTATLIGVERRYPFINSDSLFFQLLYQDLLVDRNHLKGWDLNTTFNFFPNAILYLVAFLISKNPFINTVIHGLLQYSMFMVAVFWLYRTVRPNVSMFWHLPGLMIISLFFLDAIVRNDFFIYTLFIHPYHFGAFILFIMLSALSFSYLENPRKLTAFFIFILCTLGVFSNLLLAAMYTIPWITVLVFLQIRNKYLSKALFLKMIMFMVVGTFSGVALFNWIKGIGIVSFSNTRLFLWSNIIPSMNALFETYHNFLGHSTPMIFVAIFSILIIAFNIFWCLRIVFIPRHWPGDNPERKWFNKWMLISMVFTVLVFFAPALTGIFYDLSTIRYNFFVILLPFINLGIIAHEFWSRKRSAEFVAKVVTISSLALFSILFAYTVNKSDIKRHQFEMLDYYPKIAQAIDELSDEFQLKNGISLYWTAKLNTVYSRNHIRLVQVYPDLSGFILASARSWYAQQRPEDPIPVFNFMVYEEGIEMDRVAAIFGAENLKEIEHDGVRIIVLPDFTFEKNLIIRVLENPEP